MGYVIPMVLEEETVYNLPDKVLCKLPTCTSDILLKYINSYVEKNLDSPNEMSKTVANRLKEAYSYMNARAGFLKEEGARNIVEILSNLTYDDISATVDESTLTKWKHAITFVFESDKVEATRHVVTKQAYEQFVAYAKDIGNVPKEQENAVFRLLAVMDDNKSLFKNAPFTKVMGTPFKGILLRKEMYELILYGIDFLLEKKRMKAHPNSWRLL